MGENSVQSIARQQYSVPASALTAPQQAAARAQAAVILKANRYDEATETLMFTAAQASAYRQEILRWTDYFRHPPRNGGLMRDLVTDPVELRNLTAFVTWTAWASVALRPGEDYSYTNNFPYDPSVGNYPTSAALLWSALSLMAILAGTAIVLFAFGRFNYLGWVTRGQHVHPHLLPPQRSAGQRATVKFFVIVAVLFLMQTLIGGATGHYRADPDSFYGFQLERVFPSNLLRTWHLQTAIFWIATAYVAASLFLGRSLGKEEPRWLAGGAHVLFVAFVLVIGGSLLGEWLGILQLLGDWWFWVGNQGWEFLELGRLWQYLLLVGLFVWFAMLFSLVPPRRVAALARRPRIHSVRLPAACDRCGQGLPRGTRGTVGLLIRSAGIEERNHMEKTRGKKRSGTTNGRFELPWAGSLTQSGQGVLCPEEQPDAPPHQYNPSGFGDKLAFHRDDFFKENQQGYQGHPNQIHHAHGKHDEHLRPAATHARGTMLQPHLKRAFCPLSPFVQ